jgi:hypothetical protein
VQWGPDPAAATDPVNGRVLLIDYRHSYRPGPEHQAAEYIERLTNRLGPPVHVHEYPMRDPNKREVLWVYEFAPTSD